jgi:hypothetical protein
MNVAYEPQLIDKVAITRRHGCDVDRDARDSGFRDGFPGCTREGDVMSEAAIQVAHVPADNHDLVHNARVALERAPKCSTHVRWREQRREGSVMDGSSSK